jgi:hypothetical protein
MTDDKSPIFAGRGTRPFNRESRTTPSVIYDAFFELLRIFALFLNQQGCNELDRSWN